MTRFPAALLGLLIAIGGLLLIFHDESAARTKTKQKSYAGDVYIVRGGFGVFSSGLDNIAASLRRRGVVAKVVSHTQANGVARSIIRNQKKYKRGPIILVGHSWGADAVIRVAAQLKKARLKVRFVATLAPTNPGLAPNNIQRLNNYYFSKGGWGKPVRAAPGFRGRLRNIDVSRNTSINHFNIDENSRLQGQIVNTVLRYARPRRRR